MKLISFPIIALFSSIQISSLNVSVNDDLNSRGGKYITAEGELKVLVVFAKFKDDTSSHQFWPADSYPVEMNDFIDSDIFTQSDHYLNLTNFYNQMSLGKLKFVGKAIGAVTPLLKNDYLLLNKSCLNRAKANTDILKSIDDIIDYNEFDNWTYLNPYNHLNQPDGIIDMIIIIWRGLVFSNQWSGESSLGYGADFFVEDSTKKIRMGYYYFSGDAQIFGSGVTVQFWGERSRERNFKNCIHELAHWLIQAEHPYEKFNHSFWGMLTLGCEGVCANAIEREKLGWINPINVENSMSTDLDDFITSGNSCKYHFNKNVLDEYYYFENHQKISIYDDATVNPDDKGIFILNLKSKFYKGDCVRIIPSDGIWDWEKAGTDNCWGNEVPILRKTRCNDKGFSHRDRIFTDALDVGFLYCYQDENDFIECNNFFHGYKFRCSFDTTYNNIFLFRPNDNQADKFIMKVISQRLDLIKIKFEDLTISESNSEDANISLSFILYQNYPNPFNPSTNIRFGIPEKSKVLIKIYDILGSEVATLVNEEMEAGWYQKEFNATRYASGVYIYQIHTDKFTSAKKMILLK